MFNCQNVDHLLTVCFALTNNAIIPLARACYYHNSPTSNMMF